MYEAFFQLSERPFRAAPCARNYFPAAAVEQARQTLARCLERGEGAALLTGSPGLGKTMLCHVLAEHFRGAHPVVMLAGAPLCTRRALLQAMLYQLGLPYRDLEEGELRLSLIDHIAPLDAEASAQALILLVDEAHALPLRLLEELRVVTNLIRNGESRVRLVLAGLPELEERFASPRLALFNQRVAARCYLTPFSGDETAQMVAGQLTQAGARTSIFTDDALQAVHRSTAGTPRLIQQLCDHALILAAAGGRREIDAEGIEEAWADLQQLPLLRERRAPASGAQGELVIEFGALDEEPAALESANDAPKAAVAQTHAAHGSRPPYAIAANETHGAFDPEESLADIEQQVQNVARELESSEPLGGWSEIEPEDLIAPIPPSFSPPREEISALNSLKPADDYFVQVAGAIGPEVELVFDGACDPFSESFAEEEIVIDHYAALDGVLQTLPQVYSADGRRIAALMAAYREAKRQQAAVAAEAAPAGQDWDDESIESRAEPISGWERLQRAVLAGQKSAAAVSKKPLEKRSAAPAATIVLASSSGRDATAAPPEPARDDRDLIVVEDAPAAAAETVRFERPAAPQQEYRQLFARLRRG